MCDFFSLVSEGNGKPMYFDWKLRKKVLAKELNYNPDSHTSIADYYGFKGAQEDKLNKYEYNPLTKVFKVDQLNTTDDSAEIEKFCKKLDFKTIVPQLIIKPIVHPFKIKAPKITKKHIALLKAWDSVWDSVEDSVEDSVGDSVGVSVGDSVWVSVRDSVGDSVKDSVWTSVRDSVWVSVWAYNGSFYCIKYKCNITPSNTLWEQGLVPSFDGKTWRLHGSPKGDGKSEVLWEGVIERIEK